MFTEWEIFLSRLPPGSTASSIPDLSMFAQRRASVGSNHMDTSMPLSYRFGPYMDQFYGHLPPGPASGVPGLTSIENRGNFLNLLSCMNFM